MLAGSLFTNEKIVFTRVGRYARVSTSDQAEHGYSIEAQLDKMRQCCQQYGYGMAGEYVDRGISGKSTENRHELQRLMKDAKDGKLDAVLVYRLNRLARNNLDLLRISAELSKYNVQLISIHENFDTSTPAGRFQLQILGAVSELERNTIVENVKMGLNQRAKEGKHVAKAPLGYEVVLLGMSGRKRITRIDIVEHEAVIVKRIFSDAAIGKGLKTIANSLNHDGLLTKNGKSFSTAAVKGILNNPFYIGKIQYRKYVDWNVKRRKGKNENPLYTDAVHPAIIDEDLWNKVHFLKSNKKHTPNKRFHGNYLLTGIIRCPQCGAAMTASRTNNKAKDGSPIVRMYYSCGAFRSKGSAVCSANSVRKQDAEQFVFDRLKQVLSKPQILQGIVRGINDRKVNRIKPLQDELDCLQPRIDEIERRKRKYLEVYEMQDDYSPTMFKDRLSELNADLERLHARRSELQLELRDDNSEPVSYELVRSLIEQFERLLRSSSPHQQKALLHLIIKKITVGSDRRIDKIEMCFDEQTEHCFLSLAPSDANALEGAFPLNRKSTKLKHMTTILL